MLRRLLPVMAFLLVMATNAWGLDSLAAVREASPQDVLYATGVSRPMYVPPPEALRRGHARKAATMEVIYTDFSDEAKAAFQKAVDIWSSLVSSPVKITITAKWDSLEPGVLGYCGPTDFVKDFPNAPKASQWYPIALAESIAKQDLNGGKPEIDCAYNKNFKGWYLGTDGKCPKDKIDFVTVILHEICHGLGFLSSFRYSGGQGLWGGGTGMPMVLDPYLYYNKSKRLTDLSNYANPSTELGSAITSNNIWYMNASNTYEWYAPSSWSQGSSMGHLGESYRGTINALMLWAIDDGTVIHNPGPIVMDIFKDMGWASLNSITGKVASSAGTPIQGVTLSLKEDPGRTATTDSQGSYIFSDLADGTYTVVPESVNYKFNPESRVVVLPPSAEGIDFVALSLDTVSVDPVRFNITTAERQPVASRELSVWSTNKGTTVNYTIASSADWLKVAPASGSSSGAVNKHTVSFAVESLPVGVYSATITVQDTGSSSKATVPVTVTVTTPTTAMIGTSLNEINLNTTDNFYVYNSGMAGTTLYFTIDSNAPWLVCGPVEGASTSLTDRVQIHVSYDARYLKYSNVEANLVIHGYGDSAKTVEVLSSPKTIPVVFEYNPSGVSLGSLVCALASDSYGIAFDAKRAVSFWPDQSGFLSGVSQRSKALKPLYSYDPETAGDTPRIAFKGKQSLVYPNSPRVNAGGPYGAKTVMMVFDGCGLLFEQGTKNSGFVMSASGDTVTASAWNLKNSNGIPKWGPITVSGGGLNEGYNCVVLTMDQSANSMSLYVNGVGVASASGFGALSGDAKESASLGKVLGGTMPKLKVKPFTGSIGQVWYYNRALTPSEAATASKNLLARYGVTLP